MGFEWTRLLFHTLDRGQRHARGYCEISLIPAKQTAGGAEVLTREII
jgi:hypothetical protein